MVLDDVSQFFQLSVRVLLMDIVGDRLKKATNVVNEETGIKASL